MWGRLGRCDYDIILEDFEQAGYDVNVFTEDGSVDEVGSIYSDEDELILTVTLEEGQELFIVIYVLVDLEQSYTMAIVPAGEEDPGTDIAGDGDGDGDAAGGEADRFGFGTTGDGPTDYVEGEGDVVFVDAYFSDEPEPGQLIIG
ncbi:MAG: hypothetical protein OXT09_13145 [Myxococcales bacterium]|nr:hypothetical protein [Myxococcales bacterium]